MKKILSFITNLPEEKFSSLVLRIIAIDIITIGLGFGIFVYNIMGKYSDHDIATLGACLFALGILIRLWRKEFKH